MRFSQPRSMLLGVAVVLAVAAPAHAIDDGHAGKRAHEDELPAHHRLGGNDTGNSLSNRYYGSSGGALTILWSNGMKQWRPSKRIAASRRYEGGDTIEIPKPPEASIDPPQRSIAGIKDAHAPAVFSVRGAVGAGPARYDSVLVERFGPASAQTVILLIPGGTTGAGAFAFVAPDLASRVHGLQVWSVERREQAFEDTSVIERGDPDQALAYYLDGQPVAGRTFRPPPASEVGFMAHWGLRLLLGDLRRVIREARADGRRVILGGIGLGASVAEAYAAWDFDGRAGHRDLAGLVLIDGGLLGGVEQPTLAQARAQLRDLELRPRFDPFDQGVPWVYGAASAIGGLYAQRQPQGRSPLDAVALLPAFLEPPFEATNETFLGLAGGALYPAEGAAAAHAGHPAAAGSPRAWVDGDITPIARLARWLAQAPINTVNWYVPRRLALDVQATDPVIPTPITRLLRLRLTQLRGIRLPLYAFQTSSFPHVLEAARRFAKRSRGGPATLFADPTMIHSDPLTALPARNSFLRTVTPFLKRLAH